MMTKAEAMATRHGDWLHHLTRKQGGGVPLRVRVTGKCKTWKTRPLEFRLPVIHGMYAKSGAGYITEYDAHEWTLGYE